jgi:monoamine oxidase
MSKCLIIGGGIAGLTAASILSSKNNQVLLLEASPKLGGRA